MNNSVYYQKIVESLEKNIMLTELINDCISEILYELQENINANVTTFHHTVSDKLLFEDSDYNMTINLCGTKYTIKKQNILNNYFILIQKNDIESHKDLMKQCILDEILKVVRSPFKNF